MIPYHNTGETTEKLCLIFDDITPQMAYMSVADEVNQNLTGPQKEYLQWYWKLAHAGGQWIQTLMKERSYIDKDNNEVIKKPFNPTKLVTTSRCPIPL